MYRKKRSRNISRRGRQNRWLSAKEWNRRRRDNYKIQNSLNDEFSDDGYDFGNRPKNQTPRTFKNLPSPKW